MFSLIIITTGFFGFIIASIEIEKEEPFYNTKKSLNKFMKFVFAILVFIGIYLNYDNLKDTYRVGYDNNISWKKYKLEYDPKYFYKKFIVEDLKNKKLDKLLKEK
jgi:hypothetical protein